jgi:hypothetical protein
MAGSRIYKDLNFMHRSSYRKDNGGVYPHR